MAEKQQDIHIGMKMTEAGWVPEDWDVKLVCSLCKVHGRIGFRGYTSADLVKVGEGALTIGGKNITHCTLDLSDADYISWKKYYESPEIMVKKGDIVMAQRGTLGKAAFIDKEIGPATINPSLVLLNSIKCNKQYLFYYLISEPIVFSILSLTGLTSIPMISQRQIENIPIYLPIYPAEQHRIAQVLGDIDALIASLSRTIEKKRLIKQGAMQQLLTGKTRLKGFKGEWVEKELGEIGELTSAGVDKTIKEDESPIRLLNFLDVYNRDRIYSRELTMWVTASEMKVQKCDVRCGDIFLTPSSEMPNDVGRSAVAMQDIPDACYSYHILRLRPYERLDLYYSAYMLKTPEYEQQIRSFSEGSGKRYVISLKNFREMHIRIPSDIREQETIGLKLATMDNEIESLEIELQKYKALKQGMMQKLLTGQIRLSYGKES